MRILANENLPRQAVEALRLRGHDVLWVRTEAPGSTDEQILARASAEARILLTFHKDFGELVFRAKLPAPCGIVLLRIPPISPALVVETTVSVLESRADWAGHFAVIEGTRVRMTDVPSFRGES